MLNGGVNSFPYNDNEISLYNATFFHQKIGNTNVWIYAGKISNLFNKVVTAL